MEHPPLVRLLGPRHLTAMARVGKPAVPACRTSVTGREGIIWEAPDLHGRTGGLRQQGFSPLPSGPVRGADL